MVDIDLLLGLRHRLHCLFLYWNLSSLIVGYIELTLAKFYSQLMFIKDRETVAWENTLEFCKLLAAAAVDD